MLHPNTNGMKLIDRIKNIFKLQQGEYVAPQKVETIYKNKLVTDVFLHGDSTENYAVAIITVNKEQLIGFASAH